MDTTLAGRQLGQMTTSDLIAWRHRWGFTQPELAKALGRGFRTVRRWESGAPDEKVDPMVELAILGLEQKLTRRITEEGPTGEAD